MKKGQELEGMRALLACPTYGPVDPECARDLRVGVMSAARHGLVWAGDVSTDRMGYGAARNSICDRLYEEPSLADGVMWVDSDIRHPSSAILQLLHSVRLYEAEFVSGVYHQRGGMCKPVFYHFNKKKQKFQMYEEYSEKAFAPVEGCGFGFVWTSTNTIQRIADAPGFDPEKGWFPDGRDTGGFGEDLSFCFQAMEAGVQLHVNTAVQLGHVGDPQVIWRKDFLDAQKAKEEAGLVEVNEPKKWGAK